MQKGKVAVETVILKPEGLKDLVGILRFVQDDANNIGFAFFIFTF